MNLNKKNSSKENDIYLKNNFNFSSSNKVSEINEINSKQKNEEQNQIKKYNVIKLF